MTARILSALVMATLAIACWWGGKGPFGLLITLITVLALYEWHHLARTMPTRQCLWRIGGTLPILAMAGHCLWLYHHAPHLVLWLWAVVAAVDIGAMTAGKRWGRHKLCPTISPGKTVEGAIGGLVSGGVVAAGFSAATADTFPPLLFGLILAVSAQAGDLLESKSKRVAGIKDSGRLIPGHGGILDRIDGFILSVWLVSAWQLSV